MDRDIIFRNSFQENHGRTYPSGNIMGIEWEQYYSKPTIMMLGATNMGKNQMPSVNMEI